MENYYNVQVGIESVGSMYVLVLGLKTLHCVVLIRNVSVDWINVLSG